MFKFISDAREDKLHIKVKQLRFIKAISIAKNRHLVLVTYLIEELKTPYKCVSNAQLCLRLFIMISCVVKKNLKKCI